MRIDKYLAEKFGSRTKAAQAVSKGLVTVNGKTVPPSYEPVSSDNLEFLTAEKSFVSAGGYKLSKAFGDFGYSPEGKIFADVGASTGGFTDCLFQNGAKKVYCIDVGRNQLDESLKSREIVVYDNFNARNLNKSLFAEELDGITIDVSFISLTYILGAAAEVLSDGKPVFALIKPQFECECKSVGKNGIVREEGVRKKIIEKIYTFAIGAGLAPVNLTNAPIIKNKNIEYVVMLEKRGVAKDINSLLKCIKV